MKKSSTLLLSVIVTASFAQSISLINPVTIINGYATDPPLAGSVTVVNNTAKGMSIICERTGADTAFMHSTYFCWGKGTVSACYGPAISISPGNGFIVPANTSTNVFVSDVDPKGYAGVSTVHYKFYDVSTPDDSVNISFQYNILATGINELKKQYSLSVPYPNPADQLTSISYSAVDPRSDCAVEIYDLLGSSISSYKIENKNGVLLLPTGNLATGIYVVGFKQGAKVLSSQKLIVAHK